MPDANSSTDSAVLIVGAGPTGLLLALELCRHGLRPRIIDALPAPSPLSRALVVHARTLELLDRHGLAEAFVARGEVLRAFGLRVGGRLRASVPLGHLGTGLSPFPFLLTLSQDQTELLLRQALAEQGVEVEWNTRLLTLSQTAGGVTAGLQRAAAPAETARVAYLAGCDGARSAVRHALGVGFPGGTYEHLFFVADTRTDGLDQPGQPRRLQVALGRGQFFGFFPMPGGRTRIIGLLPPAGVEQAEARFEQLRPALEAAEHVQVREVGWFSTYRVHHRVADTFRQDRVFLLGDAAHVHSPVGGQGMNTGLGDAVNLGWKLAAVLRGAPDRLLDTYAAERIPFARRLVATTDRAFSVATEAAGLAAWTRTRLVPRLLPWLVRLPFVRRLMFRTVSQTGIRYPSSALSRGRAGQVRGGDRLPWGSAPRYELLRRPGWQLLSLGEPPTEARRWAAQHGLPLTAVAPGAAEHPAPLYLVRPDGYIGLALPRFDEASLSAYAAEWQVRGAAEDAR